MIRLTNQRGVSLMILILAITAFASVAIGTVTLLRSRYESYPYQVQSYQAATLAQAGAEFAVRYAMENVDSSGSYILNLLALIAANNGRFNLGDGAFQLNYVTSSVCKDVLYSLGCSTRFSANGTCPGATRQVRLEPFGSIVGRAILSLQISSAITKQHYDYGFGNYSGSRIGFNFCDYTPVYSKDNMYIPHATITGLYGPTYVATIAATRDGAGKQVTLGRLGFTAFGGAFLWIWDTGCGPCLGPVDGTGQHTYAGQLLPAWDKTNHPTPLAGEVFNIVPVQHSWYAHTRWPTSGAGLDWTFIQDRPHSGTQCALYQPSNPPACCAGSTAVQSQYYPSSPLCDGSNNPPCCEPSPGDNVSVMNCIDTHASSGYGWASRTEATCSGEVSGGGAMGLMGINVQVPGGGQTIIETLGDVTPPVTLYFRFPYLQVDVQGCETGTNCRTLYPPVYVTWTFTLTN